MHQVGAHPLFFAGHSMIFYAVLALTLLLGYENDQTPVRFLSN